MLEFARTQYLANLGYLKSMLPQIPDASIADPVCAGGVTPGWIIGHLAVTSDFIASLLGAGPSCPTDWAGKFGPGTKPSANRADYPALETLVSAYERAHATVMEAAARADPQALASKHGIAFLEKTPFHTVGEVAALLMCSHEGTHLGQLSVWRRLRGHAPLF